MLILFDIDATLITTSRSGIAALHDAGRELFGPSFTVDGVEFAGRLDPLIIADLLDINGLPTTPRRVAGVRAGYGKHLKTHLGKPGVARALPGVMDLLDALGERKDVTLGLLTGNYPETGTIKLRACGIDPDRFSVRVWGDESPHTPARRDHLPPIGLDRCGRHLRRAMEPGEATIVGDTVHDVACALSSGCRALGVATGSYSVDELVRAGAHRVVPDLSSTAEVVGWLLGPRPVPVVP